MKRIAIILLSVASMLQPAKADVVPGGKTFLESVTRRDSILVGDRIRYGFRMDALKEGTILSLPDFKTLSSDTLAVIGGWELDTLDSGKKAAGPLSVRAGIVIAPFEEGVYELPPIPVLRTLGDVTDTIVFEPSSMEVCAIQIDTATFTVHDIKGQLKYPWTFKEIMAILIRVLGLLAALAGIIISIISIVRGRKRHDEPSIPLEPAYVRALRMLEGYGDEKWWAPSNQKKFYSAITDALKLYISESFVEDAKEMTTAELFAELEKVDTINRSLMERTRELFDVADMVKFAKAYADNEFNGKARPLAVEFINSTRDVL